MSSIHQLMLSINRIYTPKERRWQTGGLYGRCRTCNQPLPRNRSPLRIYCSQYCPDMIGALTFGERFAFMIEHVSGAMTAMATALRPMFHTLNAAAAAFSTMLESERKAEEERLRSDEQQRTQLILEIAPTHINHRGNRQQRRARGRRHV